MISTRLSSLRLAESICLLLILLFLSGCGQKPESTTITFAVGGAPAELDFWQVLIGEFQDRTGIKVDLLRQPTDTDLRRQGLITSLKAGRSDPDVFLMDVAWLGQFAASDWLEPLDTHNDLDLDVFFEKVLNLADRYQGHLIALPVYVDGGLLYYRQDLLNKYGFDKPPQTWSELLRYSLVIQKGERETNPDFYGFVWQGAQYEGLICNWLEYAGSNAGGIVFEDGRIILHTPANVQATQFMHALIHIHKVSPPNTYTEMKEEEARTFFQQGNALFERNWPYAWALHQSEDSPVRGKVGLAGLPHFSVGPSVSTLGGWHIGISKHSDAKQKSFEFMKFVLSFETQKRLALELSWNPGRRDVYTDQQVIAALPHFTRLRGVFENLRPRPNLPYYTLISQVLQRHLNAVLSGNSSATEALSAAEREAQTIVDRYAQ
ncbi:MAG: extracellular solute-binding protein [Actinobacteria bacterium]|nr:extracellular solute-binding protein [Actinomycetota bacterium]